MRIAFLLAASAALFAAAASAQLWQPPMLGTPSAKAPACGATCTSYMIPGSAAFNPSSTSTQLVAPYAGVING